MTTDPRPMFTVRNAADAIEALPYFLGAVPDDRIVVLGMMNSMITGAAQIPVIEDPASWDEIADQTVHELVIRTRAQSRDVNAVLVYLFREPEPGCTGLNVVQRFTPLARALDNACAALRIQVEDLLLISTGHWWSLVCADPTCCDPGGTPLPADSSRVGRALGMGAMPRESDIAASLAPVDGPDADAQTAAFDALGEKGLRSFVEDKQPSSATRQAMAERTKTLAEQAMQEFRAEADTLSPDTAAELIAGLQDREVRDHMIRYTTAEDLPHARRLWQFLTRRCIPPYDVLSHPALTLYAITAWADGDIASARVALQIVHRDAPHYRLAILIHEAINLGLSAAEMLARLRRGF